MLVPSIFDDSFVDDFFNDMFTTPFGMGRRMNQNVVTMNADVQEYENEYRLDLELPGFKKEDIQAELKDGYLTINAVHTQNKEEKNEQGRYIRRERYLGQCQRSFYVGEAMTQEDIKASFENGVLHLMVPKKEATPAVEEKKYIEIKG